MGRGGAVTARLPGRRAGAASCSPRFTGSRCTIQAVVSPQWQGSRMALLSQGAAGTCLRGGVPGAHDTFVPRENAGGLGVVVTVLVGIFCSFLESASYFWSVF